MTNYTPLQIKAYDLIKERILDGEYKPDTIYSLTKEAATLGISRTPLKDAMTRLANDRYIDIIPSKGFVLHHLSDTEMYNTYQVRCALESFAAIELAKSKSKKTLNVMKRHLQQMKKLIDAKGKLDTILQYDLAFHEALISSLDNPEISSLFESNNYTLYQMAAKTYRNENRFLDAHHEHMSIIEAIESGSVSRSFDAVTQHLDITRDLTIESLRDTVRIS